MFLVFLSMQKVKEDGSGRNHKRDEKLKIRVLHLYCPIEKVGTKTTATNSFGDTKTPRDQKSWENVIHQYNAANSILRNVLLFVKPHSKPKPKINLRLL